MTWRYSRAPGTFSARHPPLRNDCQQMSAHPSERNASWLALLIVPVIPKVDYRNRVLSDAGDACRCVRARSVAER